MEPLSPGTISSYVVTLFIIIIFIIIICMRFSLSLLVLILQLAFGLLRKHVNK
jgi:hypothetical protein